MNPIEWIKNAAEVAWSTVIFRFDAKKAGLFSRNDLILLTGVLFLLDVISSGKGYFVGSGLLFGVFDAGFIWYISRIKAVSHATGFACLFLFGHLRIALAFIGLSWLGFILDAWCLYAAYRLYIVQVEAPKAPQAEKGVVNPL